MIKIELDIIVLNKSKNEVERMLKSNNDLEHFLMVNDYDLMKYEKEIIDNSYYIIDDYIFINKKLYKLYYNKGELNVT